VASVCFIRYSVELEGGTDMLKAVKDSIRRMTSHLQLISSYLEMKDHTKALR
jgi:hypothetical protein